VQALDREHSAALAAETTLRHAEIDTECHKPGSVCLTDISRRVVRTGSPLLIVLVVAREQTKPKTEFVYETASSIDLLCGVPEPFRRESLLPARDYRALGNNPCTQRQAADRAYLSFGVSPNGFLWRG
jgi:hypothetical protein